MNKETLLIAGVFVGTLIVANYVMGMKVPKKAEPMSNASGGGRNKANKDGVCQCKGGVIGYCGSTDCKTCCDNYLSANGCGCSGYSGMGGCCGA